MIAATCAPEPGHAASKNLQLNSDDFHRHFSRQPFLIRHNLCEHPLFDLERLLSLAKTLPEECLEYNAGQLPVSIDHSQTPRNGLSADETIRRIAECKSWMVLKYVERDSDYRRLLNDCLDEVRPHSEKVAPGMCQAQSFVFITSPGSVTPLHIDPEHNFLLQIRGSKTVHLYDGRDRTLLPEKQLEHFYCDRGRNMQHQQWFEEKSWTFDLQSGYGLHFPVTYPHWVQNGGDVSISYSITFRTPDLDRRRALYAINDRLRRWKLAPSPVGARPWRDAILFNAFRAARRLGLGG
jgi:hypothetical protein